MKGDNMYKALIVFFVSITSLVPFCHDRAFALDCPKPPEQVKKEWEVQVNAAVLKIGPVKGGELQTRIKNTTNDLLAKLPDAAWVYLELMMYSAYCSAVRDDKTTTDSKKRQLINEYNSIVRKTIDAKLNPQQKTQAEVIRQSADETVRQLSDVSKKATAEIKEKLSDIKKQNEN
jgi:IS1 family transposase